MEAVTGHKVILDHDVKRILEIMQTTIPANKLRAVAQGVCNVGALIWARYPTTDVEALRFVADSLTISCATRSDATELDQRQQHVDDDSAVEGYVPRL